MALLTISDVGGCVGFDRGFFFFSVFLFGDDDDDEDDDEVVTNTVDELVC